MSAVAVDPKLVGNYAGIGIATFIAGMVFYGLFRKRDRQGKEEVLVLSKRRAEWVFLLLEEKENLIGTGKRYEDSGETLTRGDVGTVAPVEKERV